MNRRDVVTKDMIVNSSRKWSLSGKNNVREILGETNTACRVKVIFSSLKSGKLYVTLTFVSSSVKNTAD